MKYALFTTAALSVFFLTDAVLANKQDYKPLLTRFYDEGGETAGLASEKKSFTFGNTSATPASFTFGDQDDVSSMPKTSKNDAYKPVYSGTSQFDAAILPNSDSKADFTSHLKVRPETDWQINHRWSAKFSGDIDYFGEYGSYDFNKIEARYHENYIRYTKQDFRITAGAQNVIWGRVDGYKPTDQLGSQDFRRFIIDDSENTHQAVPAVRGEYFLKDYKIDGMFVPWLRPSELADRDSLWSLIDTDRGRTVGIGADPALAAVIQNATFDEDDNGLGGGGIRVSKTGDKFDYAFTTQYVRNSMPFYEVNPQITSAVLGGTPLGTAIATATGETLETIHPWTWVVGGDIAVPYESTIFRAEGAWLSNVPVYNAALQTEYADQVQMVAGAEFYPGDSNLRVITQLAATWLVGAKNTINRETIYAVNGNVQNEFAQGRWTAELDYSIGLNKYDVYLNPKLSYTGYDNHELYVEAHVFDGDAITTGGYFEDNTQLMVGWKHTF